jgi:hypothetical protein
VQYSHDNLLDVTKKEPGAAMEVGMSVLARYKSHLVLSLSTIYLLTITYPCFILIASQKSALFQTLCPSK